MGRTRYQSHCEEGEKIEHRPGEYIFRGERAGEPYKLSRQWVNWHVIEHDLHHGGELSFSLGAHHLAAPDL